MWEQLVNSDGWKAVDEILSSNLRNFNLTAQMPALSLDQLIACNSATHRMDALRHVRNIPRTYLEDLREQLKDVRARMADDTGESNENLDFRNKF